MSNEFKVFCRISDYLKKMYPEIHRLFEGTCSILNLNTKGKPGLTLLIPQDKAYIKKISDLAFSANPEDGRKACDHLNALILRDVFKSSADWNAKKANIPNNLYPSQHVEIASASGKDVTFKSGAKAVLDDKFIDSSKRNNLAVWLLVSGEIPVTTDKPSKPPVRGKKATGGSPIDNSMANPAYVIIKSIEEEYLHILEKPVPGRLRGSIRKMVSGGHYTKGSIDKMLRDPFLEATLSLVQYSKKHNPDMLYNWILPHISFNKIDIYNILQPYSYERMLSDEFIHNWCEYCLSNEIDFQGAIDCVDKCLQSHRDGSLMYRDRIAAMQTIDSKRVSLLTDFDRTKFALAGAFYGDIESGSVLKDLFPEMLREWYRAHPGLKQHEDEMRYITTCLFQNALNEVNSQDRINETKVIFDKIREYSESQMLILFNPSVINNMMLSGIDIESRINFIKSTYYVFIPLSSTNMRNFPIKNCGIKPKINSKTIWMIHHEYDKIRSALPVSGSGEVDIIQELNVVSRESSEEIKKAVIAAYNRIQ